MTAPRFTTETITAPPLPASQAGGYGSDIVAAPGTDLVVFSRHMGRPRIRWLSYRLGTREFSEGRGLPGDLRAGVFRGGEAWLLATHGLCRVSLNPPKVLEVVKTRLGSYKHRLFELTPTLLGVAARDGQTLTVVDTDERRVVKQLRTPSPDLVLDRPSRPVLCAFEAGVARDLDVEALRVGPPISVPRATGPFVANGRIVALAGPLAPYGRVLEPEPLRWLLLPRGRLGRLIRRIFRRGPGERPLGFAIAPERIIELAAGDLALRRTGGRAARFIRFLGSDSAGRLIATTETGVTLVDPDRLEPIASLELGYPAEPACWVPEAATVVVLHHYLVDPLPRGFDPVPEKLVLVRW